jgi:hypothetical protein
MHAGSIAGSHGSVAPEPGRLNVIGGAFTPPAGTANSASSNAVRVSIWGRFGDNAALDVEAWGAVADRTSRMDNVVTIGLHGVSAQ